jgi:superfamily I DNA/RNA helicase
VAEVTIYFGPPGTGKTATLLNKVSDEIRAGVPPSEIAYVAFTRRAASEARGRAMMDFELSDDDLCWWRTLHSTAARELGVTGSALMVDHHWDTLGDILGMRFSDLDEAGRPISFRQDFGCQTQAIYYLWRSQLHTINHHQLVNQLGTVRAHHTLRFAKTLNVYKKRAGLLDYADLLDEAPGAIGARVVLLDEAQDLTPQQWLYFSRLCQSADRVYVAGDDEQAVFDWAGADVNFFLKLKGRRVVLNKSHRLPRSAYRLARKISGLIKVKQDKVWQSSDREGEVIRFIEPGRLNLGTGTWLLLARTRNKLVYLESVCRAASVRYLLNDTDSVRDGEIAVIQAWEKLRRGQAVEETMLLSIKAMSPRYTPGPEAPIWHVALTNIPRSRRLYYESILRKHGREELLRSPRVRIDTIHGAKGAEADNVIILPDLTPKITQSMRRSADPEHRIWYVGSTRCRDGLYVVPPAGDLCYDPIIR